jgi:CheY-like chemotaxis protein
MKQDPEITLLIVEDDLVDKLIIRHVLRGTDFTILEADDVQSALAQLTAHADRQVILLTSLYLPGTTGYELIWQIADQPQRYPQTKAVLMSSLQRDELISMGIDADATPLLTKPFTAVQLLNLIQELKQNFYIKQR